ncbi:MAG TPA: hypothetical protein VL172_04890 [Kofleriaceae bacterium]|nr:hypothetical protein [Kofleriaceae bacterium]
MKLAAGVGALLVAAHAALLAPLLAHCRRSTLEVRVRAPRAAAALSVAAEIPAGVHEEVTVEVDGAPVDLAQARVGPGLHRVEWSARYRGGFERRVGVTQLVGPFQDPQQPPCSVRLLVGQALLDDGRGSPGTIADVARRVIERELDGFERWPIGEFRRIGKLELAWGATALVIHAEAEFSRGKVPLTVMGYPQLVDGALAVDIDVDADVDFDSRVYDFIADLINAEVLANRTAEREIRGALAEAMRPPPPVELPDGRRLVFDYCAGAAIEMQPRSWVSVPLSMRIERGNGAADPAADVLPVTLGPLPGGDPAALAPLDAPIAIEFSLDAINAILYYLWRTDFLDQQLTAAGVDDRFNTDSTVQEMLSIRISGIRLSLPPTAAPGPAGGPTFDLGAEATLQIHDGATVTPARAWSTIGFDFATTGGTDLVAKLTLRDLALTCEPEPGLLRPCYDDLIAEVRRRPDDLHGELTRLFTRQFRDIVLGRRIGTDDSPADFHIDRATIHAAAHPPTGVVRVDLYGRLVDAP